MRITTATGARKESVRQDAAAAIEIVVVAVFATANGCKRNMVRMAPKRVVKTECVCVSCILCVDMR